jgi:NAD(P)H-dependent FMN reductase
MKEASMSDIKVLAVVGSLRAASVNREIAALAAETASAEITVNVYQGLGGCLGELPLDNEDIDSAADLRESDDVVARLNDVLFKLAAQVG